MKVLAIESATPASSVALGEDGALVTMSVNVDPRGHVGFLVPAIDFSFRHTGWDRSDIDVVVVDYGPGPFTGIRAGLSTAQAFAAALGVPASEIAKGCDTVMFCLSKGLGCPVGSVVHVYPDMQQLGQYAVLARTNRLSLLGE